MDASLGDGSVAGAGLDQQMVHRFSPQYQAEAVELVVQSQRPVAQIARELGLAEQTLSRWVLRYRARTQGQATPASPTDLATVQALEAENARLRQENAFLKKAAAFFAQMPD